MNVVGSFDRYRQRKMICDDMCSRLTRNDVPCLSIVIEDTPVGLVVGGERSSVSTFITLSVLEVGALGC